MTFEGEVMTVAYALREAIRAQRAVVAKIAASPGKGTPTKLMRELNAAARDTKAIEDGIASAIYSAAVRDLDREDGRRGTVREGSRER